MIPRHWYFRWILNYWPCIRRTGARVVWLSPDFRELKVELPLTWKTRNRVGTLFGGSLYSAADPFFMIMLMEILGKNYVVWDQAASFQFKKPGKTKLYYHFKIEDSTLSEIREKVRSQGEWRFDLQVNGVDEKDVIHVAIHKTLYVADRNFYRTKLAARSIPR